MWLMHQERIIVAKASLYTPISEANGNTPLMLISSKVSGGMVISLAREQPCISKLVMGRKRCLRKLANMQYPYVACPAFGNSLPAPANISTSSLPSGLLSCGKICSSIRFPFTRVVSARKYQYKSVISDAI